VTAAPRPLTDDQRRLLDTAVHSAERYRQAERAAWADALAARAADVSDEVLCRETGLSRATLNRRYGPRRRPT
jgi:hypothetical protein